MAKQNLSEQLDQMVEALIARPAIGAATARAESECATASACANCRGIARSASRRF